MAISLMIFLYSAGSAAAYRVQSIPLDGSHELCGGIGFAAGVTDWTPGGFKWFNEYGLRLQEMTWLNFQFNVTLGDMDHGHCWHDEKGKKHCEYDSWDGDAVEFAVGVKLKWDLPRLPMQVFSKFGGAFDILLLADDYIGAAIGFRGGVGVRYFFFPTFGVGSEILTTFAPAIIEDHDVEFYAAVDVHIIGVEWRF